MVFLSPLPSALCRTLTPLSDLLKDKQRYVEKTTQKRTASHWSERKRERGIKGEIVAFFFFPAPALATDFSLQQTHCVSSFFVTNSIPVVLCFVTLSIV